LRDDPLGRVCRRHPDVGQHRIGASSSTAAISVCGSSASRTTSPAAPPPPQVPRPAAPPYPAEPGNCPRRTPPRSTR
jgi:hypothetical protein